MNDRPILQLYRNSNPNGPTMLQFLLLFLAISMAATVAQAQQFTPGFWKVFAPDTIGPGSVTTLQFNIDNAESPTPVDNLAFTDNLPAGMTIASPANPTSTCAGTVTAPDGGGTISFSGGQVGADSSCAITVDVTSSTLGTHTNTSGDLTSDAGNSGPATDDLDVAANRPGFSKSFLPSSVPLGGRSTLTFLIDNSDINSADVTNLDFTDLLPLGMAVAAPANASTDCTSSVLPAVVTAVPGTNLITLNADGTAAFPVMTAGSTCTVTVDVVGAAVGALGNTSGELMISDGFTTLSCGKANATLNVTVTPVVLVKSFIDDPVPPGTTVTLEFSVFNGDRLNPATNITFTDDLGAALAGLTFSSLVSSDCGGSVSGVGTTTIALNGGSLGPGDSCTISANLSVPASAANGAFVNTTTAVSATVGGSPLLGNSASDVLFVQAAPILTKEFTDDPVGAGGTVALEFTLTSTSTTSAATDIAFIDELTTFLPFPISATLPATPPCGAGSSIALISLGFFEQQGLSLTGGSLAPAGTMGDSCTFTVDIDIPVGQAAGTFTNLTNPITATVGGETVTGKLATDNLVVVAAPSLLKEFTDDPVQPGGTATLEFTLTHDPFAAGDATAITFTDDLAATLTGLAATGLPMNDICGAGSQISGTTNLSFTGGTLVPGGSCTFSVTLAVPGTATAGDHTNTTSNVTATVLGVTATENAATDDLKIAGLTLTKEFIDDPVVPGGTVTLRFTVENTSPTDDATAIYFQDNLDNTLNNLAAIGLPMNDICGAGSSLTGASGGTLLTFQNAALLAGQTCTFDVVLQVPGATASDTYVNATTSFLATVGGSTVFFDNASDALVVDNNLISLTKEFTDDPVPPGGTATLEFTITNLDALQAASDIAFTDDLDAALSGLASISGLVSNVCGAGSQINGTTDLSFSSGTLGAGAACTFSVTVQVPAGVSLGTLATNTTSQVTGTVGGLPVSGDPAVDDLRIDFLTLSKVFDGPTVAGGTPILTISITNLDPTNAVANLSLTDDLDAVISGLLATGLPLSDVCGTGSVITGTSLLALTGGNLQPAGSCTIVVPLLVPVAATVGSYLNTTSDLFLAGLPAATPATATLTIEPPPTFAKGFAPAMIGFGGVSTLSFTIDNTAGGLAASALDFTDSLPAGVVVASPPNASTTCAGGTLTASVGTGFITFTGGTVAAGASCTVQADVTSAASGILVNTTGNLTSSAGNSGTATATLTVSGAAPRISKAFGAATVVRGDTTTLSFTITNTDPSATATGITFTDDLDAALTGMVATDTPQADVCGAGSQLTGSSLLTLTGGTLAAGASCTFAVTVQVPGSALPGLITNTTSAISATVGGTPVTGDPADAAEDSVTVLAAARGTPIPTLSPWALILLVSLLSITGVLILRRY